MQYQIDIIMKTQQHEKFIEPVSGYVVLTLVILMIAAFAYSVTQFNHLVWVMILAVIDLLLAIALMPGFLVVNPNESSVLVLFGDYKGTVITNGFFWVNP
ncbi:MAG TPA: hypothetical protein DCL86_11295, partial [Bacteroidales bacterium]|nr:hypothetical protein [Bacteroidales bacterium]